MTARNTYTVIYRTGGTLNFAWKKCTAVATYMEAKRQVIDLDHMGYPAIIHYTEKLNQIGMPETFDVVYPTL